MPEHTCPVCGVGVESGGPVVVTYLKTGAVEELPPIEWRCVHESEAKVGEPVSNPDKLTGEALAAAVAERVMGWETFTNQGVLLYTPRGGNQSKVVRADTFRPDRDIAQAWDALEHLTSEKHWSWAIHKNDGTGAEAMYDAEIRYANRTYHAHSPLAGPDEGSLPTAICRAALKAIEANA